MVLYWEDGKQAATRVQELLKKYNADVQELLLEPSVGPYSCKDVCFDSVVRMVLVFSPSIVDSPWVPFFLGFSHGCGVPLLGYGPAAVPPAFADLIIPLSEDAEFEVYLEREAPVWAGEDRKQKARKTLLDQGIPVTEKAYENCIKERNLKGVALFLEAGFSPDARDAQGVPALCLAARSGDRDIINLLLKAGADVNAGPLDRGGSALIDSAMGKYHDIGADLLAAGADVNVKSRDGQSALVFSVGLNDTAFTEMLLKAGADPDDPDALGASARKYAVLFNKAAMTELFDKYAGQ
ncbi:MAG: ankyrin repeat domain-containing protein [Treponema sp.]|jgi:ankyrin repeat protein|nr:ankyrin repeat domain-containing protein [Treponema sp.]